MNKIDFDLYSLLLKVDSDDIALITNADEYDHIAAIEQGRYPFLTKEAGVPALLGKLRNHSEDGIVAIINGKDRTTKFTMASLFKLVKFGNWTERAVKPESWPLVAKNQKEYEARMKYRRDNWKVVAYLEPIGRINQNTLFELHPTLKAGKGGRVYQGGLSTVSLSKRAAKKK